MKAIKVPSKIDNDLTIDYAYFAAEKKPTSLLILSSGVHGVEAFAGSAIQQMFLEEILPKLDRSQLGILMIHTVNPYGFKYLRRVSENNVDLNRNFGINDSLFRDKNEGYKALNVLLNPKRPLNLSSFSYYFSFVEMIWQIVRHSMKPLRQAILQGQHNFAKGLYFGGTDFEPQNMLLGKLIKRIVKPYGKILSVDLHTGYGEKGKLHLFGLSGMSDKSKENLNFVFKGHKVDSGDDKDFYSVNGDFTDFQRALVPKDSIFVPITFEFGTLDSQTYTGAMKSLSNMIVENQGFQNGYTHAPDKVRVRERIQQAYYPADPGWRKRVLEQAGQLLPDAIERLQALKR